MREIAFRGKRIDNGEWVEGAYVPHYYSARYGRVAAIFTNDDVLCKTHRYPVAPTTVGQYTGLKDKNGKRIFEGDIVKSVYNDEPYTVCLGEYTYTDEYGDEQYVYGWYNTDENGYITGFGCPDHWATVIGNIHDNSELL